VHHGFSLEENILENGIMARPRQLAKWSTRAIGHLALLAACPMTNAAIVVLDLDLPLDYVAPGRADMKIGEHHLARVFYDDSCINPKTHVVRVIHMEHWMGKWVPEKVGDSTMPMSDAWLDLGSKPYRGPSEGGTVPANNRPSSLRP